MFVLGKPGLGKSSLIRRMAIGLSGFGVQPLIFGDLKPDYVDLIGALGGNVVALGRGQGSLNVLDPGAATAAALRLTGVARRKLTQDAVGRRLTMVAALVGLNRRSRVTDVEEAIIAAALGVLDEHHRPGDATLRELIAVLEEGPEELRRVTLARDNHERYREATDGLQGSLVALVDGATSRCLHRSERPNDSGRGYLRRHELVRDGPYRAPGGDHRRSCSTAQPRHQRLGEDTDTA